VTPADAASGSAPPGGAALGRVGEDAAASWYTTHGYEVLARNWRAPSGEIDLVCRRAKVLVICEVKARTTTRFGSAVESVTPAKQRRLRRLAAAYLQQGGFGTAVVRFDVCVMQGGRVEVIEGAF
jgi:putative endonuclease